MANWMVLAVFLLLQSKTMVLSLMLGLAIQRLLWVWQRWSHVGSRVTLIGTIGFAVVTLAAIASYFDLVGFASDRLNISPSKLESLTDRTIVWEAVKEDYSRRPLVGHGSTTWTDVMSFGANSFHFQHAHNQILQTAWDSGVCGLIPLAAYSLALVVSAWQASSCRRPVLMGAVAMMMSRYLTECCILTGSGVMVAQMTLFALVLVGQAEPEQGTEVTPVSGPALLGRVGSSEETRLRSAIRSHDVPGTRLSRSLHEAESSRALFRRQSIRRRRRLGGRGRTVRRSARLLRRAWERAPPTTKYFLAQQSFKCQNYAGLFSQFPELTNYDYFLFLDDDIVISPASIEKLIATAAHRGLDLCQPSLTATSDVSWPHLRHKEIVDVELTEFVEVQCFLVSRRLLRVALPYFFMAKTGLYLDVAVSTLARRQGLRCGVVHSVQMHHPFRETNSVRRLGTAYDEQHRQVGSVVGFCLDVDSTTRLDALWTASRLCEVCNGLFVTFMGGLYMVRNSAVILARRFKSKWIKSDPNALTPATARQSGGI